MVDAVWCVDWTEYERGWGSKFSHTDTFSTKAEALAACQREYDSRGPVAPDWYMNPSPPYLRER